jgi:hypothetical protein
MEPSGRNRWQPVANRQPQKPLKQADPQPVATHGNRFGAHGKEGVNGSSPLEGSAKVLVIRTFFLRPSCKLSRVLGYGSFCGSLRISGPNDLDDGKEGVNGSSPLEGSAKASHVGRFCVHVDLQIQPRAVGMEPFMEL